MPSDLDGDLGRKMTGIVRESRPLSLAPNDQVGGGLYLDLDRSIECQGERIKAGTEICRTGGGACEHEVRLRDR